MKDSVKYKNTEIVFTTRMTLGEYHKLRGWALAGEDPNTDGFLIESADDTQKPNHKDFSGCISWMEKNDFEKTYKVINEDVAEQNDCNRLSNEELCAAIGHAEEMSKAPGSGITGTYKNHLELLLEIERRRAKGPCGNKLVLLKKASGYVSAHGVWFGESASVSICGILFSTRQPTGAIEVLNINTALARL